jgi:hypothetical protein
MDEIKHATAGRDEAYTQQIHTPRRAPAGAKMWHESCCLGTVIPGKIRTDERKLNPAVPFCGRLPYAATLDVGKNNLWFPHTSNSCLAEGAIHLHTCI